MRRASSISNSLFSKTIQLQHNSCYYNYLQRFTLVNIKLKWVKDPNLDAVVSSNHHLKAVNTLITILSSSPHTCLPIYSLRPFRAQLSLPKTLKVSTFLRKYPNIFLETHVPDTGGTPVPWFGLTHEALQLNEQELNIRQQSHVEVDIFNRFCKLLMLSNEKLLPLHTVDQLKYDLGLPFDYQKSLILKYPDTFRLVSLPNDRLGVKLESWDNDLAVSELEKSQSLHLGEDCNDESKVLSLSFPIRFTRGFGLKRKCMSWLEEWQKLPYTSPYHDHSHLDPRTDVSEKRNVGVFHELLHLMLRKQTERKNVSNLRKPLGLPQKFTKIFERHPGIFYISKKLDTQTVVLREAYEGQSPLDKYNHPLVDFREKLVSVMRQGFIDRSRGLYKKSFTSDIKDFVRNNCSDDEVFSNRWSSEEEQDSRNLSEYDSDDTMHHLR